MPIRVYVDGVISPPEDARVSVFDRGFLFGDSVFETVGTVRGRLFAWPEHLARLRSSAARIGLDLPADEIISAAVEETLAAAGNEDARVRVMVTRGTGPLDLDPATSPRPSLFVIVQPLGNHPPNGVSVGVVGLERAIDPRVKSGNYLASVLAVGEARRRLGPSTHEAIFCRADGTITEGASSNVFVVKGGEVRTPPLEAGILSGITRALVLEICGRYEIAVHETSLRLRDLREADEIFITSATRGVLPVVALDGAAVAGGKAGPVTRRLADLYAALQDEKIAASGAPVPQESSS
jgi:branched-chain amino acid aminotransferase